MTEQIQSVLIRYLLGAASLLVPKSLVTEVREGLGAAESGVSR
jgi:hypothetical protein